MRERTGFSSLTLTRSEEFAGYMRGIWDNDKAQPRFLYPSVSSFKLQRTLGTWWASSTFKYTSTYMASTSQASIYQMSLRASWHRQGTIPGKARHRHAVVAVVARNPALMLRSGLGQSSDGWGWLGNVIHVKHFLIWRRWTGQDVLERS